MTSYPPSELEPWQVEDCRVCGAPLLASLEWYARNLVLQENDCAAEVAKKLLARRWAGLCDDGCFHAAVGAVAALRAWGCLQ